MRLTRLTALIIALAPAPAFAGPAENEAIVRRGIEQMLGQGRFEIADQVFHPDYVYHGDDRDYALADTLANMRDLRTAFPDLRARVDRAVATGDLVAFHWSGVGTNRARAQGFPGNGRRVRLSGMAFARFRDGRIVEEWSVTDSLFIVRQLGFTITPPR
ncbi:MAG TPA: ester cyclase [Allosphingosinicella sp.]|nr:ester cyclase [Allosphingosinicella sp.]